MLSPDIARCPACGEAGHTQETCPDLIDTPYDQIARALGELVANSDELGRLALTVSGDAPSLADALSDLVSTVKLAVEQAVEQFDCPTRLDATSPEPLYGHTR